MRTLSVIIASRLAPSPKAQSHGELLVEAAIRSIRAQSIANRIHLQIVVGVDQGAAIPARLAADPDVQIAESAGWSQAAALNAAATRIKGELVAFLEDDDLWDPLYLEVALAAMMLKRFEFCSSNLLEVSETDQPLRLQDFPIMSSWLMLRTTWEAVGLFDESYRWHLDNEWLGRLSERSISRCHLLEAGAPRTAEEFALHRPRLQNFMRDGQSRVELVWHSLGWPLIRRLVHSGSGLAKIKSDAATRSESNEEYQRLIGTYGRLPW